MINGRYENDGKPGIPLNSLQISVLDAVNAKVKDGVYEFESVPCEQCGRTHSEKLAEKDRYGLLFPVVICRECGLIYTNPRMTQASYAQFYDCEYRRLYQGKEHPIADLYEKNLWRGKRISAFLREAGVNMEGKRVLEVGCGAGGILAHFRDVFHCQVKGCDYGSQGVEYGVNHHGLDLEVGTLESITLPWKPDIIIYSHVLEHILSLREECARIREILCDDGTVYIEVPSVKGIRQNYKWDFLRLLQNAHVFHFTLTTLTNLMGQCGFELHLGNEFTQSVFKKSSLLPKECAVVNDYACAMRFLKSTERKRVLGQFFQSLKRLPLRFAIFCINCLGLTSTVKRILKRQ